MTAPNEKDDRDDRSMDCMDENDWAEWESYVDEVYLDTDAVPVLVFRFTDAEWAAVHPHSRRDAPNNLRMFLVEQHVCDHVETDEPVDLLLDLTPRPGCHADGDDYCEWSKCPQLRDNEPYRSHRHCPLDSRLDDGDY